MMEEKNYGKIHECLQLINSESKNDPVDAPYTSYYKAREILTAIDKSLPIESYSSDSFIYEKGLVKCLLGITYMESEEISCAVDHFLETLNLTKDMKIHPKTLGIRHISHNRLGIISANREKLNEAIEYLSIAKEEYRLYKNTYDIPPCVLEEVLNESTEKGNISTGQEFMEDNFTHTLYYLAQAYLPVNKELSAEYCHLTLKRQMETNKYDSEEWSLNAATLSQYYCSMGYLDLAKNCLESASIILSQKIQKYKTEYNNEEISDSLLNHYADIFRCWTKYAINLFDWSVNHSALPKSIDKLDVSLDELKEVDTLEVMITNNAPTVENDEELWSDIPTKIIANWDEAKRLFLLSVRWIDKAKKYYTLDTHCSDYIQIIQDHSQLYKYCASFELSPENQCRMHKRRIDMIVVILSEISEQHYLLVCRQLWYECAEAYSTMVDIKMNILEKTGKPPTPHVQKKINDLIGNSIKYYDKYLTSLKLHGPRITFDLNKDDCRPVLVAYFCIGRLYGKFIRFEKNERLNLMRKSLSYYQALVDYCDNHTDAMEMTIKEYELAKELTSLLPDKMELVRNS